MPRIGSWSFPPRLKSQPRKKIRFWKTDPIQKATRNWRVFIARRWHPKIGPGFLGLFFSRGSINNQLDQAKMLQTCTWTQVLHRNGVRLETGASRWTSGRGWTRSKTLRPLRWRWSPELIPGLGTSRDSPSHAMEELSLNNGGAIPLSYCCVSRREWMGMGVSGMMINSYCGSFPKNPC